MRKLLPLVALLFVGTFVSAQTILFEDNFDAYTAGQTVASQTTNWTTWSGGTTGSEAAMVSATQAHSGANSMNVIPNNDMIYSFGNKTTGVYQVDFYYYVATGSKAHFNIQHIFADEWACSVDFATGTISLEQGNATTTYTYTPDTWMLFTLDIDLNNDDIDLNLNGVELTSWTFSNEQTATTPGTNQLGCINFYGPAANNYFVDDFIFTEIQSGLLPADINISSTPITTGGWATEFIPFSNDGQEDLIYSAYPTFVDPSVSSTMINDTMRYNQGATSMIGWTNSFEVTAAVRYLPEMSNTHLGQQIKSAVIGIGDLPVGNTITVYAWEKGDYIYPSAGTVLAQKDFAVTTANALYEVVFDTPVPINGDEIWVGYKFTTPASGYTLVMDDQALVPQTSYLKTGPAWGEFEGSSTTPGFGNFSISAVVEGLGWPSWLIVSPASGTVAPAGNETLNLTFNTTELVTSGTYNATVVVGANDPAQEWTNIPVQLDLMVGINGNPSIGVMTYPNPATESINVVSDAMINTVSVYSVNGQLVNTFNVNATTTSIDVTGMAKGNYVIEVKAGNDVVKSNIIVK
ncbi:MAG: hypothetical protein CVU05_15790 [Bacteroidetes bacterium HGW-Bacteroidetes-21]|jgi:hypothetical protein|nr:MAG: hypothetical protein CVU05_15790 [Bacteroidetes bacterium HGW-Bacteroidetes-21]